MLEPQTSAKCVIYTTKGRLDLELWAKEIPNASRIFLGSCQLGKLQNESVYQVSEDGRTVYLSNTELATRRLSIETNDRIRFNKNGIFGWDNDSKRWFITLKDYAAEHTNGKMIIGKIVNDSLYTLKSIISESELDSDAKLIYPAKIIKVDITVPYFEDLPRRMIKQSLPADMIPPKKATKVKLSYDDDDEDDDDNDSIVPLKKMKIKVPSGMKTMDFPFAVADEAQGEADFQEKRRSDGESPGVEDNSDEEEVEPAKEAEHQEISRTERERDTLKMLAMFQRNVKGKNILKREN